MSMKENLIYWAEAIERAENKDNSGALEKFSHITDPSARIYYNMAAIYLRQKNISKAEMVRLVGFAQCVRVYTLQYFSILVFDRGHEKRRTHGDRVFSSRGRVLTTREVGLI